MYNYWAQEVPEQRLKYEQKRTRGNKDTHTGRPQPHCCQHHSQEDELADTINEKDFNMKDNSAEATLFLALAKEKENNRERKESWERWGKVAWLLVDL